MTEYRLQMRILVIFLAGFLASGCSFLPRREKVVAANPSSLYSVKLYESMVAPLLFECEVYVDIEREASPYISALPMRALDSVDCRLGQTHESREWVNDRVLRFRYVYEESEEFDVVVVTNKTERLAKAVRVDTGDIHLVMDLDAGEVQTFETRHRQGTRWINAYGEFETTEVIRGGRDLPPDPRKGPRTICITFHDKSLEIVNANDDDRRCRS